MTHDRVQIDFICGLFSRFPDTPWFGGMVGSGRYGRLRAMGMLNAADSNAKLCFVSLVDANIEVYACKRTIDTTKKLPTWNHYSPAEKLSWQQAGAQGPDDSELIFRGEIGLKKTAEIELDVIPRTIIVAPGDGFEGLINIHGYVEILK